MQKHYIGYIYAISAIILWSGIYAASAILADSVPPLQANFGRWLLATLSILPFCAKAIYEERLQIYHNLRHIIILAFFGLFLYGSVVYKAGQSSTSMNMALLNSTTPVFILLIARFCYNQVLTKNHIVGMLLVIIGVIGIITNGNIAVLGNISFVPGDLWSILSAFSFAIYTILGAKKIDNISSKAFVCSVFFVATILCIPFALWEMQYIPITFNKSSVIGLLYSGIAASAGGYGLWMLGMKKIGAVQCGFLYNILPLFSAIIAVFVLGETLTWTHAICGGVLTAGVIIGTRK